MSRPSRSRPRAAAPRRTTGVIARDPAPIFVPVVITLVAFLWRLAFLRRLAASPLAESLFADSQSYWEWSGLLIERGFESRSAFFLGPLYPHALALIRVLGAHEWLDVLHVQAGFGALAAGLLADAVRRLTSWRWAVLAGLAVALHPMVVFFDALVLQESLLFVLEAALLWWVVARAGAGASPVRWAVVGIGIGALAQGRATSLALLPGAILAIGAAVPGLRSRALATAALLASCALTTLPTTIHHARVAGEWIPFTTSGGYNLFIGNHDQATGAFVSITGTHDIASGDSRVDGGADLDGAAFLRARDGRDYSSIETSRRWTELALDWVRRRPVRAAALAVRKVGMLMNWREYPQVENVDEFSALAGPVGWPRVPISLLVFALAGVGFLGVRRARPATWFVAAWPVGHVLALTPFFVTDRYRHHLLPALVVLAGIGAYSAWHAWRSRAFLRSVVLPASVALGLALLPMPGLSAQRYRWGLEGDLGARWLQRGRPDRALVHLQRAAAMDAEPGMRWGTGDAERLQRSITFQQLGQAFFALGRTGEAIASLERARTLAPGSEAVRQSLARAYLAAGRTENLTALGMDALGSSPAEMEYERGLAAARAGDLASAEERFAAAVRADSLAFESWAALVRVRLQRNDLGEARTAYAQAVRLGWSGALAIAHEALLAYASGDADEARRLYARIPAAERRANSDVRQVGTLISK